MNVSRFALAVSVLFAVQSCATVITGISSVPPVTITSEPAGAQVMIDGDSYGVTPLTIPLKPRKDSRLRVEKEGYATFDGPINTRTHIAFFSNIIIGGLIGSTVDYATGAMWEYDPRMIHVALSPLHGDAASRWNFESPILKFVFENKDRLQSDISRRSGEVLNSLLLLMATPIERQSEVTDALVRAHNEQESYPDFARVVVSLARQLEVPGKSTLITNLGGPALEPTNRPRHMRKVAIYPSKISEGGWQQAVTPTMMLGDISAEISEVLQENGLELKYSYYQHPKTIKAYSAFSTRPDFNDIAKRTWKSESIFSDWKVDEKWVQKESVLFDTDIVIALRIEESLGDIKYTLYWIESKSGTTDKINGTGKGWALVGNVGDSLRKLLKSRPSN